MTELELWAAFGRAVLAWHQRRPYRVGEPGMCSCGSPAVLCPYQGLMRRFGLPPVADGEAS